MTAAGKELIDQAFSEHMQNEHRLVADLGGEDAEKLREILERWLARLEPPAPGRADQHSS